MTRHTGINHRRRAISLVDLCMATAIAGLVISLVAALMLDYRRATNHMLNRRRAQLAAESVVEQLRAGTRPVATSTFSDDTGCTISIDLREAGSDWAPLRLVHVTATATLPHNKTTSYLLTACVAASDSPHEEPAP